MARPILDGIKIRKTLSVLEWGTDGFKYVRLRRRRKRWDPDRLAEVGWPSPLKIPNPEADPDRYTSVLGHFFRSNSLADSDLYLVLPRSEFFLRWNGEPRKFPLPAGDLIWIEANDGYGVGIPKRRYEAFERLFSAAGVRLKGIAPNFLAHARVFRLLTKMKFDGETAALVDLVSFQRQMTVVDGTRPVYCHSFEAKENKTPAEIKTELAKTLTYYETTHRGGRINRIVLLGGARAPGSFVREIAERHNVAVDTDLFPTWRGWAGAYGQAMALGKNEAWVMTAEQKAVHRKPAGRPVAALILILLSAGFFLGPGNEDRIRTLAYRRNRMRSLSSSKRTNMIPILNKIPDALPTGARFTRIGADSNKKALLLEGRAVDFHTVSTLSDALSKIPEIQSVRLGRASSVKTEDRRIVEYSLDVQLR